MLQKEFIQKWVNKIKAEMLKKFPDEFLREIDCVSINLPATTLTLGAEFFGFYEINDISGAIVFQVKNHTEAKYILYSNRYRPTDLKFPVDENKIGLVVSEYDNHLDSILRTIKMDFEIEFPKNPNFDRISNTVFNNLHLQRY